jgi:hypothetical protein
MTTKTYPLSAIQEMSDKQCTGNCNQGRTCECKPTTKPVAYLMENDESKWLGWEPDPCADRVTPLYKEKWKVAK